MMTRRAIPLMTNAEPPIAAPMIRVVFGDSGFSEAESGETLVVEALLGTSLGWEAEDIGSIVDEG